MRVWATTEKHRARLRHPNGVGFAVDRGTGVNWPDDPFTQRRIASGAVSPYQPSGLKIPETRQVLINPPKTHAPTVVKT